MDLREKARELMLNNYRATGQKYICPNWPHYQDQWLWDSCFHAIICSELGLTELAKNEIDKLLKWQRPDGWIPHQIYLSSREKRPRRFELERLFYKKEHNPFHTSITQPPVLAQAVEAINDPVWRKDKLPYLAKFYGYFAEKQDPDKDGLVSICYPCESGRDSSPEFDLINLGIPGLSMLGTVLIWYLFNLPKYKKLNWDLEKIWPKNLFNVEDLMFHCIWVDGLRALIRLLGSGPDDPLSRLADSAENAVYQLCWDEKDKIFYSLNSKNRKIKRLTVSNLFPLILDNIPAHMSQAVVEHLTNPREFWTPYPIPSTALTDREFNIKSAFYPNWRGPVWINMNWFILRGLVKHGYVDIAKELAGKTIQMVEREGFWEYYNPLNGKGLRRETKNFGWSALVVTFPKILGGT